MQGEAVAKDDALDLLQCGAFKCDARFISSRRMGDLSGLLLSFHALDYCAWSITAGIAEQSTGASFVHTAHFVFQPSLPQGRNNPDRQDFASEWYFALAAPPPQPTGVPTPAPPAAAAAP